MIDVFQNSETYSTCVRGVYMYRGRRGVTGRVTRRGPREELEGFLSYSFHTTFVYLERDIFAYHGYLKEKRGCHWSGGVWRYKNNKCTGSHTSPGRQQNNPWRSRGSCTYIAAYPE